ncbi:hypothetical protein ABLA76_15205 [Xenorhabdus sp. SGI240]|uniref:hypothetical protein n=1 Tax=Xenorhabdus griffiniae TaxID=351672 RepID=UPI000B1B57E9|nr:hypothetical protein [Xenorhabdus griffiniae]
MKKLFFWLVIPCQFWHPFDSRVEVFSLRKAIVNSIIIRTVELDIERGTEVPA